MNENTLEDVRDGMREKREAWDTSGCVGLADHVLCRLEAVPRAALRLDVVSDHSRRRTRKVKPGNELEDGRVRGDCPASVPWPRVAASCPEGTLVVGWQV